MSIDINYNFLENLAKNDFENEDFDYWEDFKYNLEKIGMSYQTDFDEASYEVYVEKFKKLCEENDVEFEFEDCFDYEDEYDEDMKMYPFD